MKIFLLGLLIAFTLSFSVLLAKGGGGEIDKEKTEKKKDLEKEEGNNSSPQKSQVEEKKDLEDKEKKDVEKTEGNKDSTQKSKDDEKKDKDDEKKTEKKDEQKAPNPSKLLKIGNLAFPVSQQPSPLISFGQNLIAEKQFQIQVLGNEFKGEDQYFINVVPSLIYAFLDELSIFISVPEAVRYRDGDDHSSGPGDLLIQFEYAPYTEEYYTYYDQISIVANVTVPTGSTKRNPNTGVGANSFFIGWTFARMGINWFYFTSYGGIFNASSHRTRFGDQFLYQYGVGRRIFNTKKWLFDWMLEFDGTYACRDKINGMIDPDSGGNIIYMTPSLFIASNESLVVQLGLGVPIQQRLFGRQKRKEYVLSLNVFWTF
jgi:hypothetical protein